MHNRGNLPEAFRVMWEDPSHTLVFDPPEVKFNLEAGKSAVVEFNPTLTTTALVWSGTDPHLQHACQHQSRACPVAPRHLYQPQPGPDLGADPGRSALTAVGLCLMYLPEPGDFPVPPGRPHRSGRAHLDRAGHSDRSGGAHADRHHAGRRQSLHPPGCDSHLRLAGAG